MVGFTAPDRPSALLLLPASMGSPSAHTLVDRKEVRPSITVSSAFSDRARLLRASPFEGIVQQRRARRDTASDVGGVGCPSGPAVCVAPMGALYPQRASTRRQFDHVRP